MSRIGVCIAPGLTLTGTAGGDDDTERRWNRRLRMYDTRTFHRVAQTQHSINEVEWFDADGKVGSIHRSEFTTRYVYKQAMALLLRLAGFSRWEILGVLDRRPLERESVAMVVLAWDDGVGASQARSAINLDTVGFPAGCSSG